MSSGKWRPFCLGLNVLTFAGQNLYACRYPNLQQGQPMSWYIGIDDAGISILQLPTIYALLTHSNDDFYMLFPIH